MTEQLIPAARLATKAKTPFPGASAEYAAARRGLLAEEIEFRRHMTRLSERRRALPPGPVISKNYSSPTSGCSGDYANDLGLLAPDGSESPALVVFKRDADKVLFWASEMTTEMADPGQGPRDAPDIASLCVLDLTPGGRATDWYPKLKY